MILKDKDPIQSSIDLLESLASSGYAASRQR